MNPFKISGFGIMSPKASPREIARIVDQLNIAPSGNLEGIGSESAGISAIQLLAKRYTSLEDYIVDMNLYVEDAVNRRAQIVVFPAFAGLLPLSLLPQSGEMLQRLQPEEHNGRPDFQKVSQSLSAYSDFIFDTYYATMSMLAARHEVYVMSGSTLYFDGDEPRHRAFLFDDGGALVGFQDKVGLGELERELSIKEGAEIKAFDTPLGPVSILIGDDVRYFETARIAAGMGVRLILNPTVFVGEYTPVDMADGLNLRVQENMVYGVQSVLVGDSGFGFTLEGACIIFAPNEIVRSKNGILEKSSGRFAPDILYRRLNLDKLDEITNPYTQDRNTSFMEKYVDRLY